MKGYTVEVICSWCGKVEPFVLEESTDYPLPIDWQNPSRNVVLCPRCSELGYELAVKRWQRENPGELYITFA